MGGGRLQEVVAYGASTVYITAKFKSIMGERYSQVLFRSHKVTSSW